MFGCGGGAILEALPTPLGSTATLFIPPAFAGPRANEAAGAVKTMNNAIATFTEVLDSASTIRWNDEAVTLI